MKIGRMKNHKIIVVITVIERRVYICFKFKNLMTINRKRYNSDEERAKAMLLIWLEQSGEGTYGKFFTSHEDNCNLAKERVRRRVRLRDVCVCDVA